PARPVRHARRAARARGARPVPRGDLFRRHPPGPRRGRGRRGEGRLMSTVLNPSGSSAGLRNGAIPRPRPTPPTGPRVLLILARIAGARRYNRVAAGVFLYRRKPAADPQAGAPRTATPGKRVFNVLLTLGILGICAFGSMLISTLFVGRLTERLSPSPVEEVAA